ATTPTPPSASSCCAPSPPRARSPGPPSTPSSPPESANENRGRWRHPASPDRFAKRRCSALEVAHQELELVGDAVGDDVAVGAADLLDVIAHLLGRRLHALAGEPAGREAHEHAG